MDAAASYPQGTAQETSHAETVQAGNAAVSGDCVLQDGANIDPVYMHRTAGGYNSAESPEII